MRHYYFIGNTEATRSLVMNMSEDQQENVHIFDTDIQQESFSLHNNKYNNKTIPLLPFSIQTLKKHVTQEATSYENAKQIYIIITVPILSKKELQFLYSLALTYRFCTVFVLPKVFTHLSKISFDHLRKISLEDVLFDNTTPPLTELSYLNGKRILITGAGGTLGSELALQLLHTDISTLYLLGHGEHSIYKIHKKLCQLQNHGIGTQIQCVPLLCELLDKNMLIHVTKTISPQIVFHAAAYKHVELIEKNPIIGLSSNIFATQHCIDASLQTGVEYFVYISSDKSVEPESLYGASKLVAEEIVNNVPTHTMHSMVLRSGNILGSRGSVLPLFHQQVKNNIPITVTSKACKRFFITCSDLVSTLLQFIEKYNTQRSAILAIHNNQEISIYDLAKDIQTLYKTIYPHSSGIEIIGLRQGEKITEKFIFPNETMQNLDFPNAYTIERSKNFFPVQELDKLCSTLRSICYLDTEKKNTYLNSSDAVDVLAKHIPSFRYRQAN